MRSTRVARRYARAYMEAAGGDRMVMEQMAADLAQIGRILHSSRQLRQLLSSPVVQTAKKRDILRAVFAGSVRPETAALIDLLLEKQRETALPAIVSAFQELYDRAMGIVNAQVTTAVECTPAQADALRAVLERHTHKRVRMHFALDRSIQGGLVVRIGDTVLDASVRHQLERLRARWTEEAGTYDIR